MLRKLESRYQKIAVRRREKLSLFAGPVASEKISLAKHYNFVTIARAVVDYRGCNEVDGRSPVERAAAAFVPDLCRHCTWRRPLLSRPELRAQIFRVVQQPAGGGKSGLVIPLLG